MEREKALGEFREKAFGELTGYRERMAGHLLERADELTALVQEAAGLLGRQMKERQKEEISFLYGSILKTDLLQGKYRFFFHAMDRRWYLDTQPLEVYVDAGRLLAPFDEMWARLTEESGVWKGVVNAYDVRNIMFEELRYTNAQIAGILRYHLRGWEEDGIFSALSFSSYWLFKWGEYRDRTEFIVHRDRTVKEGVVWKETLKKARYEPEALLYGYWYQGEYEDSDLPERDMRFSVFEECRLEKIRFERCNLEGSRFTDSRLRDCSFTECSLWGADFRGCTFENVTFAGADLTGALFPAKSVAFLHLEPDQLQDIVPVRKEEA